MNAAELEEFHRLAYSEKSNFLEFVSRIGRQGLQRIFKFPGEDFSFWWFSIIAEKATLKSDAYSKVISLLLAQDKKPTKKTFKKIIKETFFYQAAVAFLESLRYLIECIYIKYTFKHSAYRKSALKEHNYILVSYFPLHNKITAEKGVFENCYFEPFHKILEKECKGFYSHLCIPTNLNGYTLHGSVRLANVFTQSQTIFFLGEFLKPEHLLLFIVYYFYFFAKFLCNIGKIKSILEYGHGGKKINVWRLFKEDFYRSFSGVYFAQSLWYILLFKEFTKYIRPYAKISVVFENQSWEKALYIYANKVKATTIGFQHAAVPELLLNYFNVQQEIRKDNFLEGCPLPDYVATVGRMPAELFIKYGWPRDRVFIWGAQRFENLKGLDNSYVPRKIKEDYFVCAFSIDALEAQKLLLMLNEAFSEDMDYKIFLKSHPTMDLKKIVKKIGVNLNPGIFIHTDADLSEIIPHAKGIIVTESSSSFFALACSIPIITPRFAGKLDCSPLSYVSDIPIYIYSPEQLLYVCNQIATEQWNYDINGKGRKFLKEYLYFPKDNGEYLEKIAIL